MAAGSIIIDLLMRTGSFETDTKRAAKAAKDFEKDVIATARSVALGLGAIATAAGATFLALKKINDGVDALKDTSEATGATVENISALENIARRAGGTLDTASGALLKFNQVLKDADPDKGAGAVLRSLNLDIEELKRLDPAEAMLRTAKALSTWADDGNRARAVQELFGKSTKDVAGFLNDLAEAGQLNATVTTQQALEAEKFAKQMASLDKNLTDVARTITGPLIAAFNELIEKFKEGQARGDSWLKTAWERYKSNIREFYGIKPQEIMGPPAPPVLSDEDRLRQAEDRGFKPSLEVRDKPPTTKPKRERDASLTAEQVARIQIQAEEEAARESAEAWDIYNKYRLKESEERVEAEKEQWRQVFEFIDQEQERAIEEGKAIIEAGKEAKQAAAELGMTFASAFEDAIVEGKKLSDVLKGLAQDILRILARKLVTEPLANLISGSIGPLFGGARAAGGPVTAGVGYLVGERGPEYFQPNTSGRILPNSALGGGRAPRITIENHGARIQQRTESNGDIRLIIDAAVAEVDRRIASGTGSTARALKSRGVSLSGNLARRD